MNKIFLPIWLLLIVGSCNEKEKMNDNGEPQGEIIQSEDMAFTIDTITTELDNPWGMAFLPDGRILITEKAGDIRIVKDDELLDETMQGVPEVYNHGQGGLLDLTLHPDYDDNGWLYLSFAKPGEGGGGTTIARAKIEGNTLTNLQELFSAQPFGNSEVHFGSRIVFDGKGNMFFSSGERGKKENAQDLNNHLGKILRLKDDGQVPPDNPFVGQANAKPEIWSYGHRNPQGLIYDVKTDRLWDVEHGPKGGDELNLVEKGKNYGWPVITYGINYDGTPITDIQEKEGMEQPVRYWVPSIAPCDMMLVTSDRFPAWENNILIGALSFQYIARVKLNGAQYTGEEKILDKVGRVRTLGESRDGYIYVAVEGDPGLLLKIIPAKKSGD